MKAETIYKKTFYKVVNSLENCSDTVIEDTHCVVIERGITLCDGQYITYHLEDNTINFYNNVEIILKIYCIIF